jgi:uncharacterized membrane protein
MKHIVILTKSQEYMISLKGRKIMDRKTFIKQLRFELKKKRKLDVEEVIYYYDELIQDAVETGEIENEVVDRLGDIKSIVRQVSADESFITKVKETNLNSLKNVLSTSVKIISAVVFAFLVFIAIITGGSIMVSGVGVIISALIAVATAAEELAEYLILFGTVIIGIGMILLGLALIKNFIIISNNLKFTIIRKTKNLLNKKEGNENE